MDATLSYMFAVLLVVLGFIALLAQRIYIDPASRQTDVRLPLGLRLKTNYPALAFLICGFGAFIYALESDKGTKTYMVEATLVPRNAEGIDLVSFDWAADGDFEVNPRRQGSVEFDRDVRRFTSYVTLPAGKPFEEQIEEIRYDGKTFYGRAVPTEATDASTPSVKRYRIEVEPIGGSDQ